MMLIYFGIFTLVCVATFVVASLCRRKARRFSKLVSSLPWHSHSRSMGDRMDSRSVKLDDRDRIAQQVVEQAYNRDRIAFSKESHELLARHLKKAKLSPDDEQDVTAAERARRIAK